jgi:glycosyltransferase involved in cell wall biosynthesis
MFVAHSSSGDPTITVFRQSGILSRRIRRYIRRRRIGRSLKRYRKSGFNNDMPFSDIRSHFADETFLQCPESDVINLHWIAQFMGCESLSRLFVRRCIFVWTLHDMNPFTGGCHYDCGCDRYKERCGACPQLASKIPKDLSRKIWERKQLLFKQIDSNRLHIVTPSRWLAGEVNRSSLLKRFPVTVIPNGLDVREFVPREKRVAREALGIETDARVILFVSQAIDNRRKGFFYLVDALKTMENLSYFWLVTIGRGKPEIDGQIKHLSLGNIESNRILSLVYSAADILVHTSEQDNLPNTVMEALACGTPVVGFQVGGVVDMIEEGQTGFLVPFGNVGALKQCISSILLNRGRLLEMATNCRRKAKKEYDRVTQAKRYVDLYASILREARAPHEMSNAD